MSRLQCQAQAEPNRPQVSTTDRLGLVRRIAQRIAKRLPSSVELDDLVHYGVLGLIEAQGRYEPDRGVPFEAFAAARIRGAILDAIRAQDWVPRSVRRASARLQYAHEATQTAPNHRAAVARRLGMDLPQLGQLERQAQLRSIVSLETPGPDQRPLRESLSGSEDPEQHAIRQQTRREAVLAVGRLPARERTAVAMYYLQGEPLKAIGAHLGVSESRACQLRRAGIERLRVKLGNQD